MLTINLNKLRSELQRRARAVPVAMANELKQAIIDNSRDSKTITGGKMRKYSPAYEKFRANHNLGKTPDLRVTGRMLDKQYVGATDTKAVLKPNAADAMKAVGNQRYRKFYPETESDIKGATLKRIIKAGEAAFAA